MHDKGSRHPSGYLIQHAHWQVDNCASENKNNFFLGFAGLLVAASVIRVVEINFMMVGHTHMKIDQIFSRFSRGIKGKNIFTRTQLAEVLQASYTEVPVFCSTLGNEGNFNGLLQGRVNRVPDITTYRAFRVEKGGDGRVKVRVKHHMHGTECKGIGRNGDVDPNAPPHDLFIGHPPRIQDAPPYELKEVSDEIIRKVEQRYLASHESLAATYPLGAQRAKNEQMDSVRRLKETGLREFDLPVHWLPDDYGGAEAGVRNGNDIEEEDGSGGPGDRGGGDETDASDSDAEEADCFRRGRSRAIGRSANDRDVVSIEEGSFAFFVARGAPFLVGRIAAESVDRDGTRGVDLHWFRPTNDHTRDKAASLTLDEYGERTFVEGYVMTASDGTRRSGKAKKVKDVSWEPVEGIVATCDKLVGNGRKIPNRVLKVLRSVVGDDRGSASSGREVQGRQGEEGRMGGGIGEVVRPAIMEDENETGEQQPENESESAEHDQEMGRVVTSRPGGDGGGEEGGGSSTGAGARDESLQGAVEEPALDADRGSGSAGVRKRPHSDTQLTQRNTRVRLTAAHFRPRR
ncbi:unnamed protein product [Ectocarpus sp. CCAP 1310/34]|nr:unnamed protein product [Ectocarpus sp. CCAP 1310/34]